MTIDVRPATTEADLAALAALQTEVTPDDPTSLEELRWSDATYPGAARFLAALDGRVVGAATVGRIYVYPPEYPDLWMTLVVREAHRRRGVGQRLLATIAAHTREHGKSGLQARCRVDRTAGIDFLAHRGFTEFERSRMVRLELAGLEPRQGPAPAGILLTDLGARPDLLVGVHAVALDAFRDIPGGDEMAVGDLAEFRARDVDRPGMAPEAFRIAVDADTGEVVGYASLMLLPGSTTVAWHDMTAVRRSHRGRGIARALKLATIDWAITQGLTALETGNDEENAPMRGLNLALGYRDLPDEIVMRGPVPGPGPAHSGPAPEGA